MAKKVGTLIKEARTAAGLTQEQLAKKVAGLSASDLSKAERGEKNLTQEQLKAIAKATGVTQKSLLDVAKSSTYTAKKKKTAASGSSGSSKSSLQVTAAEKKLVTLYRKADADTKKKVLELLKENVDEEESSSGLLGGLLENLGDSDLLSNLASGVVDLLSSK